MSLIHNERVKLTAAAIDRASTACFSIGVLAPAVAIFYNFGTTAARFNIIIIGIGSGFWVIMAAGLHAFARYLLKDLR